MLFMKQNHMIVLPGFSYKMNTHMNNTLFLFDRCKTSYELHQLYLMWYIWNCFHILRHHKDMLTILVMKCSSWSDNQSYLVSIRYELYNFGFEHPPFLVIAQESHVQGLLYIEVLVLSWKTSMISKSFF